jgi:hypothetical protein
MTTTVSQSLTKTHFHQYFPPVHGVVFKPQADHNVTKLLTRPKAGHEVGRTPADTDAGPQSRRPRTSHKDEGLAGCTRYRSSSQESLSSHRLCRNGRGPANLVCPGKSSARGSGVKYQPPWRRSGSFVALGPGVTMRHPGEGTQKSVQCASYSSDHKPQLPK